MEGFLWLRVKSELEIVLQPPTLSSLQLFALGLVIGAGV